MIARGKAEKQAARAARLSAALRENLKRRKAQARARTPDRSGAEQSPPRGDPTPQAPDFRRNRGRD
jgi:hypothetical protein